MRDEELGFFAKGFHFKRKHDYLKKHNTNILKRERSLGREEITLEAPENVTEPSIRQFTRVEIKKLEFSVGD